MSLQSLMAIVTCAALALLADLIVLNWLMGCGAGGECWLIGR